MYLNAYKKLCTEFYDITKADPPVDALQFYLQRQKSVGEPVLEPMCGFGRFINPFLAQGIDIDGTDASPHMLQACRYHCEKKGLSPILYEQFLEELKLPRKYRFIFIPAGSFSLIVDSEAAKESLVRLYDHLYSGGKLILEIETPRAQSKSQGRWVGRWIKRQDGAKIILSCLSAYDPEKQIERSIHRYELLKDGHLIDTEFEDFELRLYELDEFQQLLEATGFIDVKASRPYGDTEPDDSDETIGFSCRKPQ